MLWTVSMTPSNFSCQPKPLFSDRPLDVLLATKKPDLVLRAIIQSYQNNSQILCAGILNVRMKQPDNNNTVLNKNGG